MRTISRLSVAEAIEALTSIAEIDFNKPVEIAGKKEKIAQNQLVTALTAPWLGRENPDETVQLIRSTFRVILRYLQQYHRQHSSLKQDKKSIEGIKTIMVIVGEATKKLQEYTTLIQDREGKPPNELKEYRQLQEFYSTRIARRIDESVLGKWILELTKYAMQRGKEKTLAGKSLREIRHLFIDLETLKRDQEYELLFIRKEDGSYFFNPQLVRNMKLTCDFGQTLHQTGKKNPLRKVRQWRDLAAQITSEGILQKLGPQLDTYFKEVRRGQNHDLTKWLNQTLFALMLASNPQNSMKRAPVKSCFEYFIDFQYFLRKSLQCREYKRLLTYPPKRTSIVPRCLLETVHSICAALFSGTRGVQKLLPVIESIFQRTKDPLQVKQVRTVKPLSSRIAAQYALFEKLVKRHPYGPILRSLELMDQAPKHVYDPLSQHNLPCHLYSLYTREYPISLLRLPTPTVQEYIQKARVGEEFKGFLHSYADHQPPNSHLIINLQDRTSWREYARSAALEEVQTLREFIQKVHVVTLSLDSDFYFQTPPYAKSQNAKRFITQFTKQMTDENCGYFFPEDFSAEMGRERIQKLLKGVHQLFFQGRPLLARHERCNFIEIAHLLTAVKLFDYYLPRSCSFTCKDGIDKGGVLAAEIYLFFTLLSGRESEPELFHTLTSMLHTPSLLYRERVVFKERMERLIAVIRHIEEVKKKYGRKNFASLFHEIFDPLFPNKILNAKAA